jgi:BirA family biotin operon repressor/biotin-[acetyl-CoA-carboxylase] ligase
MELTLRPQVPMYCLQGVGFVCALGAASALPDARVAWPQTVVVGKSADAGADLRFSLRTSGGFDDEGVFVRVSADGLPEDAAEEAAAGMRDALARWEQAIAERSGAVAGPLAPLLDAYVAALAGFGERVEVVFPNGSVAARGSFVGVDVWGRATVRTEADNTLDLSPEQASLRRL